jgi:hypothetical protein
LIHEVKSAQRAIEDTIEDTIAEFIATSKRRGALASSKPLA